MAYTTIDNPELYFQTKLYTGDGSTSLAITLDGSENMQPDLIWIKAREGSFNHNLFDVVRGSKFWLGSNSTAAEDTGSGYPNSFDSDGFTLNNGGSTNNSGTTFASWNWKAGTSFTNDASATGVGSFDSTGSVSTAAGFSVISYTGNGSGGATVAHGLGSIPHMYIIKRRDTGSSNWHVYHQSIGATKGLRLNLTNAENTTDIWQDTAPTSSVFSLGSSIDVNASGGTYIGYIFSEVKGYSKFGSYTGNGNADGPFVYTGFKPAWVMIKRTDTANDWNIQDSKRTDYNGKQTTSLQANTTSNESTIGTDFRRDMLSNGFKIRNDGAETNASGGTYIYMAFAESPFVNSSGAVPNNAR